VGSWGLPDEAHERSASTFNSHSCFLCLGDLCLRLSCGLVGGGVPTLARACRLTSFAALNGLMARGFLGLIGKPHPGGAPNM
jgi:hypothetical protein